MADILFDDVMNMSANGTAIVMDDYLSYDFMIEPIASWTSYQMAVFPWLFIVPAEILALVVDAMIYGMSNRPGLPSKAQELRTPLNWRDYTYSYFNRIVMLPFISLMIVKVVAASDAIVWDMNDFTIWNTFVAFLFVFALSDLCYYTGHRIVHKYPQLYALVHKHHHRESSPQRGWFDTSNAHPSDFFYTGVSTSPMSVLWLMPAGSVHIVTIAALLWSNMFVGALGHCRLDLDVGFFRTRFHAGHHANSRCNFAQNIEMWDRMFGTYRELNMSPGKSE